MRVTELRNTAKFMLMALISLMLINSFARAPALHDVAVDNVTPHETCVYLPVSINVTGANEGDYTETFNVTAYYGNATITPGQWETFWSMGDINRNGTVDMGDYDLWEAAYSSSPGDPNWCPWADLDQDLNVDSYDLFILSGHYGLEIWTYFISGGVIETQTVYNLPSGASVTLFFTWNTTGVPCGNYTISAYAVPILCVEEDRADNNYGDGIVTVKIPDIDGDGDVDSYDFYIFSGKYGTKEGDPNWDPQCDLDNDGDVDSMDFYIFSGKYGSSCPNY